MSDNVVELGDTGDERAGVARRVALVCMPFCGFHHPSLAYGILSQVLRRAGHRVDVFYFNLDLTAHLGWRSFDTVRSWPGTLLQLGEWLYADPEVSPGFASDHEYRDFAERRRAQAAEQRYVPLLWSSAIDDLIAPRELARVRSVIGERLATWLRQAAWGSYDVVGFTVNDQQLNASLRLAHAIKHAHPETRVIMGGVCLHGPMGPAVLGRHPWLDAVFDGFAEETLPDYVRDLPAGPLHVVPTGPAPDLDDQPTPAYDDFFAEAERLGVGRPEQQEVLLTTNRGCWWGHKHPCTFCGTDHKRQPVQSKSVARVSDQLRSLSRHGRAIGVADDMVDLSMLEELAAEIDDRAPLGVPLYANIKVNAKREHLVAMRELGAVWLQPGIDHLSTPVLRAMSKGVTAVQNVWLLRTGEELGLHLDWKILLGSPGEQPEDCQAVMALLPALTHLGPPVGVLPTYMYRFSPMFNRHQELGLTHRRAGEQYRAAFGDYPGLEDQAYIFDFDFADGRRPWRYGRPVIEAGQRWVMLRALPFSPRCEVVSLRGRRYTLDTRRLDAIGRSWPRWRRLSREEWRLLEVLASPLPRQTVAERLAIDADTLGLRLQPLLRHRLVLELDGRLVRLVVVRDSDNPLREVARSARGWLTALRQSDRVTTATRQALTDQLRRWRQALRG